MILSDASVVNFLALLYFVSKLIPSINSKVRLSSLSLIIFANLIFGLMMEAVSLV